MVPKTQIDHSPHGNLLTGGGCSVDTIKQDFYWTMAAFRGFKDSGGDPYEGGLRTPNETWWPALCLRCEKLAFVRIAVGVTK